MSLRHQQSRTFRSASAVETVASSASKLGGAVAAPGRVRLSLVEAGGAGQPVVDRDVHSPGVKDHRLPADFQPGAKLVDGGRLAEGFGDRIGHVRCQVPAGPSRQERRQNYRNTLHQAPPRGLVPAARDGAAPFSQPASPRHLGTFDGERKANSRGYDARDDLARQLLGLAVTCAILVVVALTLGAL